MIKTPPCVVPNAMSDDERFVLLDYLKEDDNRTDSRPDVRSKHPIWNRPGWPQHIISDVMDRIIKTPYTIDEVVFRQDKIGLKPHTDYGSLDHTTGKTMLFLLDAQPEAQTVFFKNYFTRYEKWGAFFTKTPWNRYQYPLVDNQGKIKIIKDLRDLLSQCESSPDSVTDFKVTDSFIAELKHLIRVRSLPNLEHEEKNQESGYTQPGIRLNNYELLSDYQPDQLFDKKIHEKYLTEIPIEDLHGLTIESIIDWQPNAVLIFDREQLHSSSNRHKQKSFINVFYHVAD